MNQKTGSRSLLILLLILGGVMVLLFHKSFTPGQALFSNDGPLGAALSRPMAMPQAMASIWNDNYWLGAYNGNYSPNFSGLIHWLSGSMGRVNFYAPLSVLILGACAWLFFRRMGCNSRTSILAAIAAALNMNYFSNAAWGLSSRNLALAAAFLALAAIETGMTVQPILTAILAGFAIGLSITEGGDNGAILAMFIGTYAFWRTLIVSSSKGKGAGWGVAKVVVMAVFAAIMASQTLGMFMRTSVTGIVGTAQDEQTKAEKWGFATQWSLPKIETLRVIIPGLFGYRMDTPDGGQYWGSVGQHVQVEELAKRLNDPDPNVRQQVASVLSNPSVWRYSGAGEYTGILVVLVAIWAAFESLRSRTQAFTVAERKLIWFWAVMAVVAVLLSWGRHAPFYKLIYALPYFSTIRNPMKFMHAFNLCMMILFAFGLMGLSRRYLDVPGKAMSLFEQLKAWWRNGPAAEKLWTWGCIVAVGVSVVAWLGYVGSRSDLVKHLMSVGFPDQETATQIAKFSGNEVGLYIVFLIASVLVVTCILSGAFAGTRARWAGILLGLILVVDLARANVPWIIYYDWKEKYNVLAAGNTIEERTTSNPVMAILKTRPYQHRVTILPHNLGPQFSVLQNNVYHAEWLQHHFPYFGVQSIDIPQEPRVPEDKAAYRSAVRNFARLWQLTNTRYILGPAGAGNELNQQLDPVQKRFTQVAAFTVFASPSGKAIGAETNATGPFALFEFTGALPRAKLYSNWEIIPEGTNVLARLADPNWDPEQSVLISDADAPKPAGAAGAPGTAEIVSNPSPKLMTIRTKSSAPAMLLLNDKIEPEWNATIDGKPAPIYRANFLVRAVHVPAGEHEITFRYEMKPTALYVVLGCEIAGLLILAVVIWSARRKRVQAATAK